MVVVLAIDLQFSKTKSQTPDQVSPFTYFRYSGNFLENSDIQIELVDNYGNILKSMSGTEIPKIPDASSKINSATLVGHSFKI